VCVVRRRAASNAAARRAAFLGFLGFSSFLEIPRNSQKTQEIELSGATKSCSRGGVFEAPDSPEEATMARQSFQEHLKGRSVQELL
jgi:hypothetical protein